MNNTNKLYIKIDDNSNRYIRVINNMFFLDSRKSCACMKSYLLLSAAIALAPAGSCRNGSGKSARNKLKGEESKEKQNRARKPSKACSAHNNLRQP